jgi:hypothetical protein
LMRLVAWCKYDQSLSCGVVLRGDMRRLGAKCSCHLNGTIVLLQYALVIERLHAHPRDHNIGYAGGRKKAFRDFAQVHSHLASRISHLHHYSYIDLTPPACPAPAYPSPDSRTALNDAPLVLDPRREPLAFDAQAG